MMQQQNTSSDDQYHHNAYMGTTLTFPNEVSQILQPWTTTTALPPPPTPVQNYNNPIIHNYPTHHHDPFIFPPPYGSGLFSRRLQFGYEGGSSSSTDHNNHHLRFISESMGQVVHPTSSSVAPFGLHAELQKMTAQEIMDAKAVAASKSHSEAERRRRERINNHLAKLRSLLPNTTKTDKASLLAEVIQHVKELKRQTSLIAETSTVPTETDELIVDSTALDDEGYGSSSSTKPVIKASICCDDRSDLLPDLIKTLKSLKLKTLKAEITTLGGRVKNVLFITADDDDDQDCSNNDTMSCNNEGSNNRQQQQQFSVSSVQEALKAVMEKASGEDQSGSGSSVKRQRTNIMAISDH